MRRPAMDRSDAVASRAGFRTGSRTGVRTGVMLGVLTLVLLVAGGVAAALQARQEAFPHRAHEGLFPVCQGCH
ncbi:MAG TPA: hypothetical protein VLL48_01890, partial [Longimicrobiales bacterium]|nr:hypothetical protein [Longimicrobiales bacterium]